MAIKSADQITIVDLTDGYSVVLTSDAFSLMGTTSGTVATAVTLTTTAQVFQGANAVTSGVSIGTITSITGVTASISGLTVSLAVGTTCAGGLITIPVVIGSGSDAITYEKTVSISVAKTGSQGTAAYIYDVRADIGSIIRAEDGTLSPSSITFTATRAQGTGNPANYSGRFKIEYFSGSSWTTAYTSSSNESSKAYTLNATTLASATFVRCTLYLAGGTSTVLDIKTVPIVSDGATGATGQTGATGSAGKGISSITGHYLATSASSGVTTSTSGWTTTVQTVTSTNKYLWYYETISYVNPTSSTNTTPAIIGVYGDKGDQGDQGDAGEDAILIVITTDNGTVFKNSSGSTTLTATVYKGGNVVTGTALSALGTLKWYKDGGSTAVGTGATLSVAASSVTNKAVYEVRLEA